MPIPYDQKIAALRTALDNAHPRPQIAVETGTYHGDLALRLLALCPEVHTIELSDVLFAQHPADDRVQWHCGDTRRLTPELAGRLTQPVLWFLDAHYFSGRHAAGAYAFPLWTELAALARRSQADIIVVDDVHTFGRRRGQKYGDWHNVTPATIADRLTSPTNPIVATTIAADMHITRRRGPLP